MLDCSSSLADALFSDPTLIPVINRFGIYIGVSDDSVEKICRSHSVNSDFFLAVVNTFLNADYYPMVGSGTFPVDDVVEYLRLTDKYYAEVQLPNIERHFGHLLAKSHAGNNLAMLRKFFVEMKQELLACIDIDKSVWFPKILSLRSGCGNRDECRNALLADKVAQRAVADKVSDLASFFILHLRGDYDPNLCMAVVSAVFALSRDIGQNNRIRERLLRPMVMELLDM